MSEASDLLTRLHTDAVDARNGYAEAIRDSDGHAPLDVFERMRAFHSAAAAALETELRRLGVPVDYEGSLMSVVHQSIMKLRSLVGKLDESVLAGLIDGEQRNLKVYDEALDGGALDAASRATVERQRADLRNAVAAMQARQAA